MKDYSDASPLRIVVGRFSARALLVKSTEDGDTLFVSTIEQSIARRGKVVRLPRCEFRLVLCLLPATLTLVSKPMIFEGLWGDREDGGPDDTRVIDIMLCKMRRSLAGLGVFVETVWGRGFRMWGDCAAAEAAEAA